MTSQDNVKYLEYWNEAKTKPKCRVGGLALFLWMSGNEKGLSMLKMVSCQASRPVRKGLPLSCCGTGISFMTDTVSPALGLQVVFTSAAPWQELCAKERKVSSQGFNELPHCPQPLPV